MRLFRQLFMTVVGVVAVGCALAASASASGPTLLFWEGFGPTVLIASDKEPNTIKSSLQSTSSKLTGEGFLIELTLLQLSSPVPNASGTYTVLFLNVEETFAPKDKCHSEGDAQGEVLVTQGTILLVYDSLSPVGVAARLAVPEVKILCGTVSKIKVKGSLLSLITPLTKLSNQAAVRLSPERIATRRLGKRQRRGTGTSLGSKNTPNWKQMVASASKKRAS